MKCVCCGNNLDTYADLEYWGDIVECPYCDSPIRVYIEEFSDGGYIFYTEKE